MKTVTLYHVICDQAYSMSEQGTGYSLRPWGGSTDYYHGGDDGGREYILPDDLHLGRNQCDELELYDAAGRPTDIVEHSSGRPQAMISPGRMPVLKLVQPGDGRC